MGGWGGGGGLTTMHLAISYHYASSYQLVGMTENNLLNGWLVVLCEWFAKRLGRFVLLFTTFITSQFGLQPVESLM